jgi:hypothetical protein
MADFIEFLLNLLDVGELVSRTGEWALALFNIRSNWFVEFVVGLLVWAAGIGGVTAVVMLK